MRGGMTVDGDDARIASVSASLLHMSGDRAVCVAECQAAEASGDAARVWEAIATYLAMPTRPGPHADRG